MYRAAFALLCTCLAAFVASADGTIDDFRQWTSVHVSHRYDDRFSFNLLSQVRFSDDVSEYDETVLKPAAHFVVAPGFKLTLGYHFANKKDSPDEHRVWEQVAFGRSFADLDLGLRGRLEQRFINHLGGTIVRNRYRLKAVHPLWDTRWYAVGTEEVFVNFNGLGAGPVSGFEQNRLFGGVGLRLGQRVRVESGYLWRHAENRDAPDGSGRPAGQYRDPSRCSLGPPDSLVRRHDLPDAPSRTAPGPRGPPRAITGRLPGHSQLRGSRTAAVGRHRPVVRVDARGSGLP